MSELDKFKRRLIRAVARLMITEKVPETQIWEELKKETGCDCRVLWQRMRAVTLKKLARLLPAEDRVDNIAAIARMSVTDWLLYELVLVHERIDVIGLARMEETKSEESKPLLELFSLVQRFGVEEKSGAQLADAWAALTVYYNHGGRQCAPMLLQRRWYELKEVARERFYGFWYVYRGNPKNLAKAMENTPTKLQRAIAKRFPEMVLKEFLSWEKLIEKRMVILPGEFQALFRMSKNLPKPCDANDPEIVIIEPPVETIDLDLDSDSDEARRPGESDVIASDPDASNDPTDVRGAVVKEEPIELVEHDPDGLSNVRIVETTHMEEEQPEPALTGSEQRHRRVESLIKNVTMEVEIEESEIASVEEHLQRTVDQFTKFSNRQTGGIPPLDEDVTATDAVIDSDLDKDIINNISSDDEAHQTYMPVEPLASNAGDVPMAAVPRTDVNIQHGNNEDTIVDLDEIDTDLTCNKSPENLIDSNLKENVKPFIANILNEYSTNIRLIDTGIEFIDDGVEFEEYEEEKEIKAENAPDASVKMETDSAPDDGDATPKFDLKLLMDPVVYTRKLDHMGAFRNRRVGGVRGARDLERIAAESRPVSARAVSVPNVKQEDTASRDSAESDARRDNDDLFETKTSERSESADDSETEITDERRVKITNGMFQKPRNRTYNFIQVCKNPDFNTRLKRLNVGFFTSERNRELLKACKPATVDLHKSFESKLWNGTLYLKPTGVACATDEIGTHVENTQKVSVVPSAMPVQGLFSNRQTDINDLLRAAPAAARHVPIDDGLLSSRSKVIHLPDRNDIRRINQHLLTAQVTPIKVTNLKQDSLPEASSPDVVRTNTVGGVSRCNDKTTRSATPKDINGSGENTSLNQLQLSTRINSNPQPANSTLSSNTTTETTKTKNITNATEMANIKDYLKPKSLRYTRNDYRYTPWRSWRTISSKAPWLGANFSNDDTLLAADTLNKMLLILDGQQISQPGKSKKKKKIPNQLYRKPTKDKADTNIETPSAEASPKENEAVDCPEIFDSETEKTNSEQVLALNTFKRSKPKRKDSYCCWARAKISRKVRTQHTCPWPVCSCCCRLDLVEEYKKNKTKMANAETAVTMTMPDNDEINISETLSSEPLIISDDETMQNKTTSALTNIHDADVSMSCISIQRTPVSQSNRVTTSIAIQTEPAEDVPNESVHKNIQNICNSIESVVQKFRAPEADASRICQQIEPVAQTCSTPEIHQPIEPVAQIYSTSEIHQPIKPVAETFSTPKLPVANIIIKHSVKNHAINIKPRVYANNHKKSEPLYNQEPSIYVERKKIIIDASSAKPVPNLSVENNEKIIVLSSKQIAKAPTKNPIFLGKNKILLTTVKLPQRETLADAQVYPCLPGTLPSGVHMVLLPSGDLTYYLDAGVQLTPEQLSELPNILKAVQQQISASGVPLPDQSPAINYVSTMTNAVENVNLIKYSENLINTKSSDSSTENLEISHSDTGEPQLSESDLNINETVIENTPSKETAQDSIMVDDTRHAETPQGDQNKNLEMSHSNTGESHLSESDLNRNESVNEKTSNFNNGEANKDRVINSKETETAQGCIIVDNTRHANDGEKAPHKTDAGRKTILSDLMEMSGISSNDTATSVTPLLNIPQSDAESVLPSVIPITSSKNLSKNLPQLTPITSLEELVYASNKNGKFFKLDFITGILVPISVSIKKPIKKQKPIRVPESVIDLTDDCNANETDEERDTRTLSKGLTKINEKTKIAKPLKLFKAVHPNILKKTKESSNVTSNKPSELVSILHKKKAKRKQNLHKIEAKIDLVDSDAPVEEEYLLDSSDEESNHFVKDPTPKNDVGVSSDDSSDDEPLAKKVKRNEAEIVSETKEASTRNVADDDDAAVEKTIANPPSLIEVSESFPDSEQVESQDGNCILGF